MVEGSGYEVPILARPGEFVMQTSAVEALGTEALERLNRFHKGGLVELGALVPQANVASLLPDLPKVEGITASIGMDVESPAGTGAAGAGVTINGGINAYGVKDGEDAATLLPMKLRSELFLAGY